MFDIAQSAQGMHKIEQPAGEIDILTRVCRLAKPEFGDKIKKIVLLNG
jgi:hypothetical protein